MPITEMLKPVTDRIDLIETNQEDIIKATGEGFQATGELLQQIVAEQDKINTEQEKVNARQMYINVGLALLIVLVGIIKYA